MTQSSSLVARQLIASAVAGAMTWLLLPTAPASAQLALDSGAFAVPSDQLGVARMTVGQPKDQFTYFTPGDSGTRVGLSASQPAYLAFGAVEQQASYAETTLFGARLDRDLGPVDLTLSGQVGAALQADLDTGGPTMWSTGVEVGLRGLSIAGFYTERRNEDAASAYSYDAALRYRTGPWGFALAYRTGSSAGETAGSDAERLEQYTLALNYRLSSNVEFGAYGGYVAGGPEEDPGVVRIDDDISGFVFGTGLSLDF